MKTITVDKKELRAKINGNRATHRKIFEEAVEGYRKEGVRLLEEHIASIKAGKMRQIFVSLPVPQDHTKDYDRVLAMLDMEMGDKVEVSEQEFSQYVLDDWSWRREFISTANSYNSRTAMTVGVGDEE